MSGEKLATPEDVATKEIDKKRGHNVLNVSEKVIDKLRVKEEDYPIFSKQAGLKKNELTGKHESRTLNINETMSRMVGSTAAIVAALAGEDRNTPPADTVIYLDKSARPVSWLVDGFWNDFTDKKKPENAFLAIDRAEMFKMIGTKLNSHQEIETADGSLRPANVRDFFIDFDRLPKARQTEILSQIRCVFIDGGIEEENPEKIMDTPTKIDGKNIAVVDEVSRSGATIGIATELIRRAIGGNVNVSGHVFWNDGFIKTDDGNYQMGNTPVWYPADPNDWRGRGIMDPSPSLREKEYRENPNPKTRAMKYSSAFLGVPLDYEKEEGHLSQKLRDEISKMHEDYRKGHILPLLMGEYNEDPGSVYDNLVQRAESLGVKFLPKESSDPDSYINIIKDFSGSSQ